MYFKGWYELSVGEEEDTRITEEQREEAEYALVLCTSTHCV